MGDTGDFYRLFLMPGVEHCNGDQGADTMDRQLLIEAWVENGEAPSRIMAVHHAGNDANAEVTFTRPHCPYPQQAFYTGTGDETDAANFECWDAPKPDYEAPGEAYLR
ncbi:MAG: tannase/feruloyl esterase family alpha/beta hydrolase [Breoghania sp.]|nr:tannase/feruloyl esterase family alpha/beta hydrolase [Breoghania sp.]MDJ0931377.1 tannase/feruloyl esterase family alpha/beta hydrolase [Breoghania sp.]